MRQTRPPRRRSALRHAAALIALPLLLGADRPPGLGDVAELRYWSYPDYTRVVVELDRPVETEVRRLEADPLAARPERLYLDFDGVWVGKVYKEGIPIDDGLLEDVRMGQFDADTARLVLDLQRYDRHRMLTLSHPHRVVIDVFGRRPRGAIPAPTPPLRPAPAAPQAPSAAPAPPLAGSAPASPPPPAQPGVPAAPVSPPVVAGILEPAPGRLPQRPAPPLPAPVRRPTVVIDPGHGGEDPGAIGVGGLREKEVTLRIARSVGSELELRGFRVVLTREDDRTLSLEERTVKAESAAGDVFVSIHANAAPRRSVSGIETYYLDANYERHGLNLAARENGIPRSEVNVLQSTLARLHFEEVSPQSRTLAESVQRKLIGGMPAGRRPKDLGVKKGPFYVLFLSNMPAILVEVGFLTHVDEAARLRDANYLEALAQQIARGIEDYCTGPGAGVPARSAIL